MVPVHRWWSGQGPGKSGRVRTHPVGDIESARLFTAIEFAKAAESFSNPDWALITRNAYRSRWREGEAWDSRYDPLQRKLHEVEAISTPTLMIQGASDYCDPPSLSEGLERHFRGGYERVLLDAVGHFPHREAPAAVATAILRHLGSRDQGCDT